MYLIPIDVVRPHINPYYMTYRQGSKLLGFMPCTHTKNNAWSHYYSVGTTNGSVVPVFYIPDMLFDSEPVGASPGPALFFKGCDDGHTGLKFKSEEEAMTWLNNCPYADFELLYRESCQGVGQKLEYHN